MSHFSRTRAFGFWTDLSVLTAAECDSFDQKTYAAVNGDGGGTWAPIAPIVIGGDGFWVTSTSYVKSGGSLTCDAGGNITVNGSFITGGGSSSNFNGVSTFDATATFNTFLTMGTSSTLRIRGNATIEGDADLLVQGTSGHNAAVDFGLYSLLRFATGSTTSWNTGALVHFNSGSATTWASGSTTDFASGSTTTFVDGSGLVVATAASCIGSNARWNFSSGAKAGFVSGTELHLYAGSLLTNAGDTLRSGPETRSGSDAWTGLRAPVSGSTASPNNITATDYDVVKTPTGLASPKQWILDAPGNSDARHVLFIHRRAGVNQGDTITIFNQATGGANQIGGMESSVSNLPATGVYWWDGSDWINLGFMTTRADDLL